VFVGNFRHPPNVDAALRLTDRIFPAVRARVPGTVLRIVGAHPPPALLARARDGVDVTGRIPDVTPWMNAASLIVVPLRLGGGMRVKVVEALAHGKAVVASPRAVEGLTVTDGVHVAIADSDDEFVTRIVALLESPDARSALARNAREWAVANLGEARWVAEYEALYERLRPTGHPPS
jgi:glycosyltransferase involved in cell wall biosynthesis